MSKRSYCDSAQHTSNGVRRYEDVFHSELLAQVPKNENAPCFYAVATNELGDSQRVFVKGPLDTNRVESVRLIAACLLCDRLKPRFQLRPVGVGVMVIRERDGTLSSFLVMVDVCNGASVATHDDLQSFHNSDVDIEVFAKKSSSVKPLDLTTLHAYPRAVCIDIFMNLALRFVLGVQTADVDDVLVDAEQHHVYVVDECVLFSESTSENNLFAPAAHCDYTAQLFTKNIISPNRAELLRRLRGWHTVFAYDTAIPLLTKTYEEHLEIDVEEALRKSVERLDYLIEYLEGNEFMRYPLCGRRSAIHSVRHVRSAIATGEQQPDKESDAPRHSFNGARNTNDSAVSCN